MSLSSESGIGDAARAGVRNQCRHDSVIGMLPSISFGGRLSSWVYKLVLFASSLHASNLWY